MYLKTKFILLFFAFSILGNIVSLRAVMTNEMFWPLETLLLDDFEDMESYIIYKIGQSEGYAGHPVNSINCLEDMYRYLYFTGKATAYRDILGQ